jgi:hypothetical protein
MRVSSAWVGGNPTNHAPLRVTVFAPEHLFADEVNRVSTAWLGGNPTNHAPLRVTPASDGQRPSLEFAAERSR